MINPISYLFYKIYKFLSYISGGGNPITHLSAMVFILILNLFTFYILVFDTFPPPLVCGILIVLLLPYAIPKILDKVLTKYEKESEKSRIIGNTVVILYIILSIVLFILASKSYKV